MVTEKAVEAEAAPKAAIAGLTGTVPPGKSVVAERVNSTVLSDVCNRSRDYYVVER